MLPEPFIKKMQELRSKRSHKFFLNIVALHQAGWSLQDIANLFGVSKSAVAAWEKEGISYKTDYVLPEVPIKPYKPKKAKKEQQPSIQLTSEEEAEIFKLTLEASTVSRNTQKDAPSRIAAEKLEHLLFDYNQKGLSYGKMAVIAGVSRRAIAQRIEKERKRLGIIKK